MQQNECQIAFKRIICQITAKVTKTSTQNRFFKNPKQIKLKRQINKSQPNLALAMI